jgi:hypothetical protein
MYTVSIAKKKGLQNPYNKKIPKKDEEFRKPTDKKKKEIYQKTAEALGLKVAEKTQAAFVQTKKPLSN